MAQLIIPTPLRKYANNEATFNSEGFTIDQAIEELTTTFPDIKNHLVDDSGKVRSFIKIFVGDDDINALDGYDTEIGDDTVVSIVPAIAGGLEQIYSSIIKWR